MSKNIHKVPEALWEDDLPCGYDCLLYVGRMAGSLRPRPSNPNFQDFTFEISSAQDPTDIVLRYHTLEAPAAELARYENAGDNVGIVIAKRQRRMFMLAAYNFSRRKWFGTGYYPHQQDRRPGQELSMTETHSILMLSIPLICSCIGSVLLPVGLYLNGMKSQQYQILNPTDYRGVTAKRIVDWIIANERRLAASGMSAIDPSL